MMELPAHWQQLRLKYVATINDEVLSEDTDADYELQYVDIGDVNSQGNITGQTAMRFEDAPSRARRKVRHNDVIVSTVRTYLTAIAPIAFPPENFIVSTGFAVVRPNSKLEGQFCKYALRSSMFVDEVVKRSVGVSYPAITSSELADISICVPPIDEQQHIAAYLDCETARLDELREEKERLLELLELRRTALIAHAVTRGLDKDAPLKPSGVEWIGEVPEHWEVVRLKFLLSSPLMYGANESGDIDEMDGPRFVRITDIRDDGTLKEETFKALDRETALPYILQHGDLLLARSGATVGKTFFYQDSWGEACFAGYLIRARMNLKRIEPRFGNFYTSSPQYWEWLNSNIVQATIQNVSADKYANLPVPVPPLPEQRAIVAHLDQALGEIDEVKAALIDSLGLLAQRRSALIAEAVAGRFQVTI